MEVLTTLIPPLHEIGAKQPAVSARASSTTETRNHEEGLAGKPPPLFICLKFE